MSESVFVEKFKEGYGLIFDRNWPLWVGAVLLAFLGVLCMAWGRPWGVAGGLRVWGDWFLTNIGLANRPPAGGLIYNEASVLTVGLLFGAFGSALMARQFKFQMAPPLELAKGFVGGILMGVGSVMSGGCNVGGFYTALAAGSVSGFAMMVGLQIGALIGLKYLLWEMEHLPTGSLKPAKEGGRDWSKTQPWLGGAFFVFLILWAYWMSFRAYTNFGVLMLLAVGIGIVIQRCRFCFVRSFRDVFMTGEGVATRAVGLSIMLSVLGFFLIKWAGLRPESTYVYHHWIGGLVGGVVFGVGMLLSGGCGSGSVWRAGEGQIKLIIAVIMFALSNSVFRAHVFTPQVAKSWGEPMFLPDVVGGYFPAILISIAVMALWWWMATWNEETDKLTMV